MKLWETEDTKINKEIEKFTVGEDYNIDMSIIVYDCKASIAHAKMLHKMGILSKGELTQLVDALNVIIGLVKAGHFQIKIEDEDCHTAIENFLVAKLGKLGEKIHTFRSRNDQVVTALRLYYKDEISKVIELVNELIEGLLIFKNRFIGVKLPGYTHTRKAMPSSIGIWCDSFIASMEDNKALLGFVKTLIDQSPLGTGAGYGLPVSIDRSFLAEQLGFKKVQHSPLYVQNSRGKFEATILHALSQVMLDLNKMATDFILFSLEHFNYFHLPDELCTGSSIMPHKKNPDALELVRASYHKLLAMEAQVKTTIANLISGYHRDHQLTKKPVIEGFALTKECLKIMGLVVASIGVNKGACESDLTPELFATQEAYELVIKQGIPFREAYKKVANLIKLINPE